MPGYPGEPERVSSDAVPRRGLAVKIVAVIVVLALVAGAAALAFTVLRGGEPERSVSLPDTVAGMERNSELEGDNEFAAVREGVRGLLESVDTVEVGAYDNADESRGPVAPVFVIAGETDEDIEPSQFIDAVRGNAESNDLPTVAVPAGEDAQGMCVTNAEGDVAGQCVWATSTSFGQVIGPTTAWTPDQLGALMVQVRADVETVD